MRSQYSEWYQPTDPEKTRIWNEGLVVFDANALLGLYRMERAAAERVLDLLDYLGDRFWIPHRVGLEYHRNRSRVLREQAEAYDKLRNRLKAFGAEMEQSSMRHGVLESGSFSREVRVKIAELCETLDGLEAKHPFPPKDRLASPDQILDRLDQVVGSCVGEQIELSDELRLQAQTRMENKVPPGYRDNAKDEEDRRFGDILVWWGLLDLVGKLPAADAGILFVTDDAKDDWWSMEGAQRLGPRPELTREALDRGAKSFWMQSLVSFVKSGETHLSWEPLKIEVTVPEDSDRETD